MTRTTITRDQIIAEIARQAARKPRVPRVSNVQRIEGACFVCGAEPTPRTGRRIAASQLGLGHGWIEGPLCKSCLSAAETAGDPKQIGFARGPIWVVVTGRRLQAQKPDWLTEPITLGHLPQLTFAGLTVEARRQNQPEPTPPSKPFGWLRRKFERMDWPEPPSPPPAKLADPRLVESGCLIDGRPVGLDHPLTSYDPKAFGLTGTDRVRGRLCGTCNATYDAYRNLFFEKDPRTPAQIAASVTQRLKLSRPDLYPSTLTGSKIIHPRSIARRCWAGHVIKAREAGRPDPEPPAEPFGWLEPR